MLTGSCLCGAVRYEITEPIRAIANCHCRKCRKSHSAAFASTASVPRAAFRYTHGEATLASFESTPGKKRFFCPRCGSHLIAAWDGAPNVIVRIGSLDDDPQVKPRVHIWLSEKAPWFDVTDGLPQLPEGVPPKS